MEFLTGGLGIIAVVQLLKFLRAKQYEDAVKIVVAAIVGYGAGYFGLAGLTTTTGLTAGLTAAGIHTVAGKLGGN